MPLKTTRLDVSEAFELPTPGLYAVIVPIAFLPNRVSKQFAAMFGNDAAVKHATGPDGVVDPDKLREFVATQDADDMFSQLDKVTQALCDIVIEWNLCDYQDQPMPIPRVLREQGQLDMINDIPTQILMWIFGQAGEEQAGVPLTKLSGSEKQPMLNQPSESEQPDSLDSVPFPTPMVRSQV
jgi:hypothetical protein